MEKIEERIFWWVYKIALLRYHDDTNPNRRCKAGNGEK